MGEGAGSAGKDGSGTLRPGALSALLQEIAAVPVSSGEAWDSGLRPGAVVGRFELVREIGRGGFGVVWEAKDRELGRRVAFKAVRAGARRDLREERLLREAEAAAQLSHPNIVTLHDVGRSKGGPYLVLELLEGKTLAERLGEGALPPREAVHVAAEVAKGVAHAHGQGVVHRDLKPENVFLCRDGQVKVLDFGLAHAFGQRRQEGGTSGYMAPEQVEGAPEDERTDVWAMGAMLFEMLSGRRPFADEKALRKPAPALEVPGAPGLGDLVARMLSLRPVDRPRDGGEVLRPLSGLERDAERAPPSAGRPVRAGKRARLRFAALVALGVAAGVAVGGIAVWRHRAPTPVPAERIVVAVADFGNETRDPDLDGLSGLLITSLAPSPRLQVLTRSRMFDVVRQSGRDSVERIDEPIAREVGRRTGAKALLLASIRRFDDLYSVELRALDPATDSYLFTAKEQARGKRSVPGLVDALAARTRVALGEDETEVRRTLRPVAELLTANLEAHRHYFLGLQRFDEYRVAEARAELAEAIRLDPDFALAHLHLVALQQWAWISRRERDEHLAAASAHSDRLQEPERLILRAEVVLAQGRLDEALQAFDAALARSPNDKRLLLRVYWVLARAAGDLRRAEPIAGRALDVDPSWQPAQDAVAIALVYRGEFARAEALAREWSERWPSQLSYGVLNGVLLHAGRAEEALPVARKAHAMGSPQGVGVGVLYRTLVQLDRLAEAEETVRAHARASPDDGRNHALLAGVLLYRGKQREAARHLERAGSASPQEPFGGSAEQVFARAGDRDPAAALALARRALPVVSGGASAAAFALAGHTEAAAELLAKHEPGTRITGALPPPTVARIIDALRARDRGDLAGARAILEEIRRGPSRPASHEASFVLGETCFAAGDAACAVEALDQFQRQHWMFFVGPWAYPRSLLHRALAEERLGRRDEARGTIDRLLALWKEADPDLPLLAEAKALRKRLAAAPAAAGGPAAPKPEATPSIAVLPFADMSPGKDQEYFADGVAEEILNALTRVEGLKVIGRTSSFSFKGKNVDLRTIGRKLGASSILEGSVRRDGARIRLTARLLEAQDGRRVWSETYEREAGGLFAVQDEIAKAVVESLKVSLAPAGGRSLRSGRTANAAAHDQYLLGLHLARQGSRDGFRRAEEAFRRAIALDPGYAPAQVGLASALVGRYNAGDSASAAETERMQKESLAATERAVRLAPDLADAWQARGMTRRRFLWDWPAAQADLERALALDPDHPEALWNHGWQAAMLGRPAEGIAALERATRVDPLSVEAWRWLGYVYLGAGERVRGRKALQHALEISPEHDWALMFLAMDLLAEGQAALALETTERSRTEVWRLWGRALAHHSLGNDDDSRRALEEVAQRWGHVGAYQIAELYAWRGERDRAFEWLERCWRDRDSGLTLAGFDPLVRDLRGDPRWRELRRRMKLPVE